MLYITVLNVCTSCLHLYSLILPRPPETWRHSVGGGGVRALSAKERRAGKHFSPQAGELNGELLPSPLCSSAGGSDDSQCAPLHYLLRIFPTFHPNGGPKRLTPLSCVLFPLRTRGGGGRVTGPGPLSRLPGRSGDSNLDLPAPSPALYRLHDTGCPGSLPPLLPPPRRSRKQD